MILRSVNPYTGNVIAEFEEFTDEQIKNILNKSSEAFLSWQQTDFAHRKALMKNASRLLISNADEYSLTITREMGKPVRESRAEVEKCAWVCDYYSENAGQFLRNEPVDAGTLLSYVSYEPLGSILGIMPWNFPFWQVFRFAVPAVMAGNTVILKHASGVQMCARHIENIFIEAGFPPGVFSNLVVGSHAVARVIENDTIKGVSLTGSEDAGRKVAEMAGRNLKKCVLELGGSNAFIVLADADIEKAAETAVRARMMNAGQSCIASKRFFVHEDFKRDFIKLFIENINKLSPGDPVNESTTLGPLSSENQAIIIEDQVNRSVSMGAVLEAGGKRDKAFYQPSLLTGVKPGMPVFDEEVFGPVAALTAFRDVEEAVRLAGMTGYGLGVTIFTSDIEKALGLAPMFSDGAVFINELVKSDPRLPFGGTRRSGYGRELAVHGIREFVNVKTVYAVRP